MQFRLDRGVTASPLRELYGQANGKLLLPLDVCIYHDTGGGEQLHFPSPAGILNGAPIVDSGGGHAGVVGAYDWPPANMFAVNPIVSVDPAVPIAGVPSGQAPLAMLRIHDVVELEIIADDLTAQRTGIHGSVKELIVSRIYPDLSHRVLAYLIGFGQSLSGTSHGSRVILSSTGALVGMLIATQNQNDGSCDALVYPAHLI